MMRKLLPVALAAASLLAATLMANTLRHGSRQIDVPPVAAAAIDSDRAAEHLAGAVRLRTISHDDRPEASAAEFVKLHAHLEQSFPHAHRAMKRELVGGYSLLYTWPGSDPDAKAVMLMAHQDVVPIAAGTEADWAVDPFAGVVKDGYVWGRGAWDDKGNLFAIFEAIEALATEGFRPRQTVYVVAGHDEEVGGERGAKQVAELLRARGVRLDWVIDEGTLITDGVIKGLDAPVALIGVAEKGIMTLAVAAHDEPGHASMPPRETAIGMLAEALARIERQPMPASIEGVAAEMFATLAPEMRWPNRLMLSNLWLFGPLVERELEKSRSANALTRSTTALTVVHAGNKVNVVPARAEAFVNVRLLPGDTQDDVLRHAHEVIDNPAIEVARSGFASEASPVASTASPAYARLNRTIREVFPGTVVAPGLMVAATDSRHMLPIADHVFRFSPVRVRESDLSRFHGTNERLSIANLVEMAGFYQRLLSAPDAAAP